MNSLKIKKKKNYKKEKPTTIFKKFYFFTFEAKNP